MTALFSRRIIRRWCTTCGNEFRGVNPLPLFERHKAAHRSETVMAVSCGATS